MESLPVSSGMLKIARLAAVGAVVVLAAAACGNNDNDGDRKPTASPTVTKTVTASPTAKVALTTVTKDGFYITDPAPDGVNDLSKFPLIKAGTWSIPDESCAVTVYDAKLFASAQETQARKVYEGSRDKTVEVPESALIFAHGCAAGLEWVSGPLATAIPSATTVSPSPTVSDSTSPTPTETPSTVSPTVTRDGDVNDGHDDSDNLPPTPGGNGSTFE